MIGGLVIHQVSDLRYGDRGELGYVGCSEHHADPTRLRVNAEGGLQEMVGALGDVDVQSGVAPLQLDLFHQVFYFTVTGMLKTVIINYEIDKKGTLSQV